MVRLLQSLHAKDVGDMRCFALRATKVVYSTFRGKYAMPLFRENDQRTTMQRGHSPIVQTVFIKKIKNKLVKYILAGRISQMRYLCVLWTKDCLVFKLTAHKPGNMYTPS